MISLPGISPSFGATYSAHTNSPGSFVRHHVYLIGWVQAHGLCAGHIVYHRTFREVVAYCRGDLAASNWGDVKEGIARAKELCAAGGDWERKNRLKARLFFLLKMPSPQSRTHAGWTPASLARASSKTSAASQEECQGPAGAVGAVSSSGLVIIRNPCPSRARVRLCAQCAQGGDCAIRLTSA